MARLLLILLIAVGTARASENYPIAVDASVLSSVPVKRHAALMRFAITDRDSTPAIGEKKAKYIEALKSLLQDLLVTYYWHTDFPSGVDDAIEKRAVFLAGLHYPASPSTGCSFYGDLVQSYTIGMYEDQIVTVAYAVSGRMKDKDVAVSGGHVRPFAAWKKAWDEAGDVKDGPNHCKSDPAAPILVPFATGQ
jgi:hypothetical protein